MSGLLLPIVIMLQTIAFCFYDENKEPSCYREEEVYDSVHHWILWDYLGLIVGRKAGQDPEALRDSMYLTIYSFQIILSIHIIWI